MGYKLCLVDTIIGRTNQVLRVAFTASHESIMEDNTQKEVRGYSSDSHKNDSFLTLDDEKREWALDHTVLQSFNMMTNGIAVYNSQSSPVYATFSTRNSHAILATPAPSTH